MLKFLARRLVNYLILVFIATSLAYILASMTFHPENRYLGRNPPIPASTIEQTLKERNAAPDTPVLVRYGHWLNGVAHGDFGKVIQGEEPVSSELKRRIGVSLRLLFFGTVLGAVFGVLIGVVGAVRQRKPVDVVGTVGSYILLATPTVVIIIVVQTIFVWINRHSGNAGLFPQTGEYTSNLHGLAFWLDRGRRLVAPTIVLTLLGASFYSRYQRSAMLDVLGSDFLRTARAKGLTRQQALFKHGVRTALIPMMTFFAYSFGLLLTGATFTESLFGWNGMGKYLIESVQSRDTNAVAAVTCFTAVLVLLSGMLSDILYAALDPRVRSR
ncbi:MAG: glutathione transport system permease protein [Pseudonocardiales bacterium]|jgi:peptide/nickel transport system permease protein|nr:peptide transporter permease [Frankiales bacterium]MDQ1738129.1 glutathione transport system permease protein [Pseudonocardiales bacterium]